jgi:hypothetical protein
MVESFVEPEFEVFALETRNEGMPRVAGYEVSRPHAGDADFN